MNWVILTEENLGGRLAEEQWDAISSALKGTRETEAFDLFAQGVIAQIRAAIVNGGGTVSGTANTLPPEGENYAYWLIVRQVILGVPSLVLTEDQKDFIQEARDWLKAVSAGEVGVTEPDDPMDIGVDSAVPGPSFTDVEREFTKDNQDGI